jgi:hypothetical protein
LSLSCSNLIFSNVRSNIGANECSGGDIEECCDVDGDEAFESVWIIVGVDDDAIGSGTATIELELCVVIVSDVAVEHGRCIIAVGNVAVGPGCFAIERVMA